MFQRWQCKLTEYSQSCYKVNIYVENSRHGQQTKQGLMHSFVFLKLDTLGGK